jgi:hypothetical protein
MSQKNPNRSGFWLFNAFLQVKRLPISAFPSSAHALGCINGWHVIVRMIPIGLKKNFDVPRPIRRTLLMRSNSW